MSVHYETQSQTNTPEFDPSSTESIELWYRNLRPDFDINELPIETHLDGIASSVLHAVHEDIPEDSIGRIRKALGLTTGGADRLVAPVAAEGTNSFVLFDLLTELSEREDTPSPNVVLKLLNFGVRAAHAVRENPLLQPDEKLAANSRLCNLRMAELTYANDHIPEGVKDYSDKYIAIVRQEADWVSSNCEEKGIPNGSLFETCIGSLGKYQAWIQENDETVIVRHATMREDMPSRKADGGSGHEYAHDVVVKSSGRTTPLQCKWGAGSAELADRYDSNVVKFITETSDDGTLAHQSDIIELFATIASSSKAASAEACDRYSERYGLGKIIHRVNDPVPAELGSKTLKLASS